MAGVTTYTCNKCRPVDTEIIEAYLILSNTSKLVSEQEADRVTAEQGRVTAENERERVFGLDHGTATDDHATAVSDHGIAGDDHLLAVADHGTAGDDHTIAAGDHVTAGEDHLASTSATSRANDAAAAAEHMVDIHQGPPGADGHDGQDGQDGTGITEIEQTVTSHANGGQNTVQIRTSDGNSYNVYIKNGSASNGLFPTSSALNTACPSPAVGDFAYVGSGFPADVYVCQTAGTWTDSGEDFDGGSVDLTDYATKAEVTQLEHEVSGNLMSVRAKNALLAVFNKVAFAVPDVSAEMSELNNALFNLDEVTGINAVYTQGSTIIWSDGVSVLNDLKANLVVKAEYGDGSEVNVTNYTLSGTLTTGTSVITVEYEGFTATFNVIVTEYGSKMTYTMAEGTVINKQGRVSEYYVGSYRANGIENYGVSTETTRRVFITNFGKTKLKNNTGSAFVDAYPIRIPSTASKAITTISGSNQQIAARVLKLENGEYLRGTAGDFPYVNMNYTTGGGTLDFPDMGTGEFYLLLWGQRVNGASYAGNEPTAITVTFE